MNSHAPIVMTGATGNTGTAVVERLTSRMPERGIIALVRDGSDISGLRALGVETCVCDLEVPSSYIDQVPPGAVFLGISNLRHSDVMMPHLVERGISRAFCVTTTAVFSSFHSYSQLYRDIEDRLRETNVPLTILRPAMIYGNARDHNMRKLVRVLDRVPVFPVFGPGTALMQPVYVDDLADGIVAAVERDAIGEFNLAGDEPITYNDVLMTVAGALGRHVRLLHVNHGLAARVVSVLERVPGFPIKHEQVMRLLEDKAFDISVSRAALDYRPRSFADGIALQVAEYRRKSA